jgi:hypothetical protein
LKNEASGAGVRWFVCDAGHVHLTFVDENDNDIVSVSIDVEDWVDLADEIDEEIDVMLSAEEAMTAVKH